VLGFQTEYAKPAAPFHWTFTRHELHALLRSPRSARPTHAGGLNEPA
jgi:hypothetical protein